MGSHVLDLLDYLVGPLTNVIGSAANMASAYAVEDTVALSFRTAEGAPGSMAFNFASALRDDMMRLTGTEGEIAFPVFRSEPLRWEGAGGVQVFDLPYPPHVAQPLIQSVVDDLLGLGTCPSTGESARRTSRAMDRVLEGYYGGRTDAFWNRPETWPGRRGSFGASAGRGG
jgi:predicted dehydrogenase